MDWDLKTPSWDLTELERETIPHIGPQVGSSSFVSQKAEGDCSVDLQLGRLGDFGERKVDKWKDPGVLTMGSSPSGSSKRARAPSNGTQVSCLVEGCESDLSKCRDYHRRHKVCEVHSKTPKVMVGGQEQRFCQQCSRFHLLEEFDDVKRSCRKRLDGHNRRRRKPQPEALSTNSASLLPCHRGNRLASFYSPPAYPTNTGVSCPSWSRVVKTKEDVMLYNRQQRHTNDGQNQLCGSFSQGYSGEKQFPFFLGKLSEASVSQPLFNTTAGSDGGGSCRKMFSDGWNQATQAHESDCALSLLSSTPAQTCGISLSLVMQPDPTPLSQPLMMGLHYNGLDQYSCSHGMEDGTVGSVLGPDTSGNANLHCQGMFQLGSDGSSGNEPHELLTFSWE